MVKVGDLGALHTNRLCCSQYALASIVATDFNISAVSRWATELRFAVHHLCCATQPLKNRLGFAFEPRALRQVHDFKGRTFYAGKDVPGAGCYCQKGNGILAGRSRGMEAAEKLWPTTDRGNARAVRLVRLIGDRHRMGLEFNRGCLCWIMAAASVPNRTLMLI